MPFISGVTFFEKDAERIWVKVETLSARHSGGVRVALFSGNYNYQVDGANQALNRLVGFLEDSNTPVLVFSPTGEKPAFMHRGTVISVPSVRLPSRGEYRLGYPLSKALKEEIRRFAPTIFHLSAPDLLGHSALKFANELGIPAVASFHTRFDTYLRFYGLPFLRKLCLRIMRDFYRQCAHVYAPTLSMKAVLANQGIPEEALKIWSRGVDTDLFTPKARSMAWRQSIGVHDKDVLIGFVGRLVKEKGLDRYTDLISDLKVLGLPVKAMVVGDGPARREMAAALPDAVFTGHLSGPDLARAYASLDIFINTSVTETFGNVTLEAMASGVVPVCFRAVGSTDLVEHGTSGFLVDPCAHSAFVSTVSDIVENARKRLQLSKAAHKRSQAFEWPKTLREVLQHYQSVA